MEHKMILSASGWRKVFAESGNEEDTSTTIGITNRRLCALIGETFSQFMISSTGKKNPVVAVGTDTRPTGKEIADCILHALLKYNLKIKYIGIASAPEIMAYAKKLDGFLYISASHNPIGHNGIKFGLNNGGVIEGKTAKLLADNFVLKCNAVNAEEHADEILNFTSSKLKALYKKANSVKKESLKAYEEFISIVITGEEKQKEQKKIFDFISKAVKDKKITILTDMNGSSRTLCIDRTYIESKGLKFISFNDNPGQIVHAIIPEPENLVFTANSMKELQLAGDSTVLLGYMPDCDGDRGNIVYWNEKTQEAVPIKAQEVFALCVMAELSFEYWKNKGNEPKQKIGVAVNCPTSMRIDEICKSFKASLFRAEVGEANVVNLAREKRNEDYNIRILGEGSNGGNITNPSSVRDPLSTVFALIKLLTIRDKINRDGSIQKGLFHLWCDVSNQSDKYKSDFTLADVMETLPVYTTTGVSESRAVLKVKTEDKGKLKLRFQQIFETEWKKLLPVLSEKYKFVKYEAVTTNGTKETQNATDWNNGNGGLKIKFYDAEENCRAFIWMRPSGTEPVFRILCDVKGNKPKTEKSLLDWEISMLLKADKIN